MWAVMARNVFPCKLAIPERVTAPKDTQAIEDRDWFLSVRGKGALLGGKILCVILHGSRVYMGNYYFGTF